MMKRPAYIIGAAVVSVIAFLVYLETRLPEGLTPMGDQSSTTIAWISLAVAIVSLATTVVGLIQKLIELRAGKRA
jgi:hypothetical protein